MKYKSFVLCISWNCILFFCINSLLNNLDNLLNYASLTKDLDPSLVIKPEIDITAYLKIKHDNEKLEKLFKLLVFIEKYAEKRNINHGLAGNMHCAVEEHRNLYDKIKNEYKED